VVKYSCPYGLLLGNRREDSCHPASYWRIYLHAAPRQQGAVALKRVVCDGHLKLLRQVARHHQHRLRPSQGPELRVSRFQRFGFSEDFFKGFSKRFFMKGFL
jgi:hypothetical protein